ncbi:UNVERIFIED_CONTAM: Quinone oxidoreductase 1 [Sesamum angustifolium]|uniref:Quinone oxidoreductase 1 n=1 Tax=Sesamum angustifolium TaxID=2727405 RepID=A0AAW2LEG0_9LAMI
MRTWWLDNRIVFDKKVFKIRVHAQYTVGRGSDTTVEPGQTVLIHAANGGVGLFYANGQMPLVPREEDFVALVNEITSGKGVEVVYDSVGKDTFEGSLKCLKLCGHMMSFGSSSGAPDPVPLSSALLLKSLSLTSPNMIYYTITRDELLQTASEVFINVAAGVLRVRVNHTYPLSQAAQAHTDLESRKTSGSVVLIPDGSQVVIRRGHISSMLYHGASKTN